MVLVAIRLDKYEIGLKSEGRGHPVKQASSKQVGCHPKTFYDVKVRSAPQSDVISFHNRRMERADFSNFSVPWPQEGDELFKGAADWQFNACLNTKGVPNPSYYISGFKLAGEAIFSSIAERRHEVDVLVYPLVFNYRQYIELSLKDIIVLCRNMLDIDGKEPFGHDFGKLWPECRQLLDRCYPDHDKGELEIVERHLQRFSQVDPKSTAFRYGSENDKTEEFLDLEILNVRNLHEVVARIGGFFDAVRCGLCAMLDVKREMEAEYSSYAPSASEYYSGYDYFG